MSLVEIKDFNALIETKQQLIYNNWKFDQPIKRSVWKTSKCQETMDMQQETY